MKCQKVSAGLGCDISYFVGTWPSNLFRLAIQEVPLRNYNMADADFNTLGFLSFHQLLSAFLK